MIGAYNTFTAGAWIWPEDSNSDETRIRIGDGNYFAHNVKIDACNLITIGNNNMFGPNIMLTDSDHSVDLSIHAENRTNVERRPENRQQLLDRCERCRLEGCRAW